MPFDFHHHSPEKYGIYNLSLFEKPSESIFSVGIHPKDIEVETEKSWKWFEEISQLPQCFAIGECGLDGLIVSGRPSTSCLSLIEFLALSQRKEYDKARRGTAFG